MALPKIDSPVFELDLPLSKKHIRFRPFLVKEQKNLMMALESDDRLTIEQNVRQVLTNCTITDGIDLVENIKEWVRIMKKVNLFIWCSKLQILPILKEIEKCEIRCSNCHRKKTAKDFNWYHNIDTGTDT